MLLFRLRSLCGKLNRNVASVIPEFLCVRITRSSETVGEVYGKKQPKGMV